MNLVLVGAVESSLRALRALRAAGAAPALAVTLPRSAAGRHSDHVDLRPDCEAAGVPVVETRNVNGPRTRVRIAAAAPDWILVIGWSQIVRPELLALPARGCIGFHPSALPRFRGRAVIPWQILRGAREGGATLFRLAEGVDSGPILEQERFALSPRETARTLYDRILVALDTMLGRLAPRLAAGDVAGRPQDESEADWCARRTADDGRIDWSDRAEAIDRLVRAVGPPYPGAWTVRDGALLTVLEAEPVERPLRWIGLPGQVQAHDAAGVVVACGGDTFLRLVRVRTADGEARPAAEALDRLHERLGEVPPRPGPGAAPAKGATP